MNIIINIIKGIFIGAGAIVPGVSSGVLCVIFGIYEKLLDSVLNFFKAPLKNLKILLPILIGGGIGVLIFSNALNYLLYNYPIQTKSIFIGLIIGTIPKLIKEVNCKETFKWCNIVYMAIALGVGIITVILENRINIVIDEKQINVIYLIISGVLMSIGVVVPGVSSTIILMLLGIYSIYLKSVANLYFPFLIPLAIGLVIGCLIVMKITKQLLNKYYSKTFYAIIGFTLGSIFVLIPEINSVLENILSILGIILGLIVTI